MQIDQVIELFRGADAYVAHNCSFERSFLERYLGDTVLKLLGCGGP